MTRNQLKLLRLYTGLTQVEFAQEIGIAPGTLAKIESGIREISATTKAGILRKYDLLDAGFLAFCERMEG